ncbi:MAG: hypothetical protein MZW92_45070 [Comamonadaceae bacterium]|nr:hypothetical protein [Comamonadaceae bacterium]
MYPLDGHVAVPRGRRAHRPPCSRSA